ncbi:MAG TPA: hypothetical protein VIN75_26065 [Burkholderiaceae bacterium]
MASVFAQYIPQAWPYRYAGTLHIATLAGGTPSDPNVAEGWLRTKLADKNDLIRDAVAEVMAERGITAEEAARELDRLKHLNGFRKDPERGGELYIEGRHLKAGIKEAASVARAVGKLPDRWGKTNKGILGFVSEHIQVVEDRLHLGVTEASDVLQSFPKNARTGQTGIQYTEIVRDAKLDFTLITDHKFSDEEWAMLWLTAEQQGIGASRSQGFGRYEVVRWGPA